MRVSLDALAGVEDRAVALRALGDVPEDDALRVMKAPWEVQAVRVRKTANVTTDAKPSPGTPLT
jgi:hypothetical protein